ncbi:hypothetical protein A3F57_03205 [Candidatus Roizmanbacteria bacterium RIFCSPHIGHO2_12_FULL_36_11]|uniref:Uncharacterized protein n=1 Tax=Candidatus Curtissbacteria bacterium RIFCSPLOWO2_01_FULL_37_9 TaxID=1797724 RepID=A0A1F5GUF3_9BACT|nr:MAG: hypothetical protein A3A48_03700 [Candidatus Curtissbacteria bacterium RIFCSPLOWO2_01_FULL_37_9]OGK32570.1 MAG: hypothetical protein A3F57_03205 [Candidatus Roizmanbacteria bacterium RIFCSPHIGHO2_12_FULL_36_11]
MKNQSDLEKLIPDFEDFKKVLWSYKNIIDTGKLTEYYCSILFGLTLTTPRNYYFDALTSENKKVEVKHRFYSGNIPPGMKIKLENIDVIYYVELEPNLLPKRIYKFLSEDITYTMNGRVSFQNAFNSHKAEVVYSS